MNRIDPSTPTARSWRDIPQEIAPRAMSRVGRRRSALRTMRSVAVGLAVVAVAAAGALLLHTMSRDPQRLAAAAGSEPVSTILVESNGVLDRVWVEAALELPRDAGLMELDLYALRGRLLASGQVSAAVLMREFPSTLKVVLEERSPVVRLKARLNGPELSDLLVARDGTVFAGEGIAEATLGALPWLGGVRLLREGQGFAPLTGLDRVADLLSTARGYTPQLLATWRVVSLERLGRDGEIVVQSSLVPEIVFGTREDFFSQLARLDLIVEQMRRQPLQPVRSINLAVGPGQVPVALQVPATSLVSPAGRAGSTVRFPSLNR